MLVTLRPSMRIQTPEIICDYWCGPTSKPVDGKVQSTVECRA